MFGFTTLDWDTRLRHSIENRFSSLWATGPRRVVRHVTLTVCLVLFCRWRAWVCRLVTISCLWFIFNIMTWSSVCSASLKLTESQNSWLMYTCKSTSEYKIDFIGKIKPPVKLAAPVGTYPGFSTEYGATRSISTPPWMPGMLVQRKGEP